MGLPIGDATVWKSATSINGDDDSTELAGLNSDDPEDSVIAAGTTAVAEVWRLATARDVKWTLELQRGSASVWSSEVNGQEILKSEGEIAISPLVLHQLLHKNIEKHPEWNPLTDVYEVVKTVDRFTDITYTVAPAMGGGMISPRDYVSIRKWFIKDGNVVIAEVGCEHPDRQVSLACARALSLWIVSLYLTFGVPFASPLVVYSIFSVPFFVFFCFSRSFFYCFSLAGFDADTTTHNDRVRAVGAPPLPPGHQSRPTSVLRMVLEAMY